MKGYKTKVKVVTYIEITHNNKLNLMHIMDIATNSVKFVEVCGVGSYGIYNTTKIGVDTTVVSTNKRDVTKEK